MGKKYLVLTTGPTRAAKAEQKLWYLYDKPNEPTKEGPLSFVLYSLSPHSPQFQHSAGATPPLVSFSLSVADTGTYTMYTSVFAFLRKLTSTGI